MDGDRADVWIERGIVEPADGDPSLEDYTLPELREIADEQGVDLGGATKKADIIQAIREA